MVSLYKDPKGEKVFDSQGNGGGGASQSLGSQPNNIYEKVRITVLEKKIAMLEQRLEQTDRVIYSFFLILMMAMSF